jgi:glycosyltransferase involved in cell wall biosynthesis
LRVLFLSTLPREAPSARPRVFAYLPALREAGIEARVSPFLGDAAFRRFYRPGLEGLIWKAGGALTGYARRAVQLTAGVGADVVVIHREAVPRGNRWVLGRLKARGVPVVYDLDDAIYLAPRDFVEPGEDSRDAMNRGKDPGEVDRLLAASDLALVGNETLAAHAREVGARRVEVLPTPVDTDRFRPDPAARDGGPPLLGWIGSPTATYCIRSLAPALSRAAKQEPFRLLVVGASGPVEVPGVEVIRRDWSLDREAADHASLAVGLYPLPDNPWTRGKCGYKALLYAACAVPCVASPVGVNREIVRDGETGFHAADDAQWEERLLRLLRDPALRDRMGAAARRLAEERWSVRVLAPRMVAALREVVRR